MRQVVGGSVRTVDAEAFAALRAGRPDLVLDVGTGDGKHVLAVARERPDALVVGLDAAPDAMRRSAARAAQKPGRGGLPNAVFVWAAVEQLPAELVGVDEVHVLMPWGSLLRAVVTPDVAVLAALAARCVLGARFTVAVNLHAWRPPVPEVGDTPEPAPDTVFGAFAADLAGAGWTVERAGYLDAAQVAGLATSWTKRLGSSRDELAVLGIHGRIGSTDPGDGQDGNWRQYS